MSESFVNQEPEPVEDLFRFGGLTLNELNEQQAQRAAATHEQLAEKDGAEDSGIHFKGETIDAMRGIVKAREEGPIDLDGMVDEDERIAEDEYARAGADWALTYEQQLDRDKYIQTQKEQQPGSDGQHPQGS